jgi:predicted RNA-binding protein YlxR (DUF448 family)/ribosomal protein L30E
MEAAVQVMTDDEYDGRERRDLVSGEVMPENRIIRFAFAPDGSVVPDVAVKLPGRGAWVAATRAAITLAVEKKLFSRAAKANVTAGSDLADRTEVALLARMVGDLGLARRSGALVLGFDNVLRQLEGPKPPKVLIEALDGSKDGKRKLYASAHRLELECTVIESLTSAELGLALGRENVIHAAVLPGGLANRLTLDAERLSGFRTPERKPVHEREQTRPRADASKNESPRADASKNESPRANASKRK